VGQGLASLLGGGTNGTYKDRDKEMVRLIVDLHHPGLTQLYQPRHPLYSDEKGTFYSGKKETKKIGVDTKTAVRKFLVSRQLEFNPSLSFFIEFSEPTSSIICSRKHLCGD